MERYFVLFILFVAFLGCSRNEQEIAGIYVKSPSVNTIDSLYLFADRLHSTKVYDRKVYNYIQRFYNRKTGLLLFENKSTWWINGNGKLELENLYFDLDNDPDNYSHKEEAIKNALISSSLSLRGTKIIVNEDEQIFYIKVK